MIKMDVRTVYRIEHPTERDGMWYNKNGVFRKTIHILCPNGIAKSFPMPRNLRLHRKDGLVWNSAGKSIDNMNQWFTASDAFSLYRHGFRLFRFDTTLYQELDMEILFCRDGVIKQIEIPLNEVWNMEEVADDPR